MTVSAVVQETTTRWPSHWLARVGRASTTLYWLAGVMALGGFGLGEPWIVALAAVFLGLGLCASDLARLYRGGITAITIFSFAAAVTGLANVVGLRAGDGPQRSLYFLYAVEQNLMLASLLGLIGTVMPVLGFWLISRTRGGQTLASFLPPIRSRVPDRILVTGGGICGFGAIVVHVFFWSGVAGSIVSLFLLLPQFAAFVLARAGTSRKVPGALPIALALAVTESIRGLLFEYLRSLAILPIIAFVSGAVIGARSLRPLRTKALWPMYPLVAIYVVYFGALAEIRGRSGGIERVNDALEFQRQAEFRGDAPKQTVLSRLTTFNQLSQIGRVAQEDGFYDGKTLSYLSYAFVPRFLWPDKPRIQRGSWFALRIGQAMETPEGWYNNAINMTVQGELYLNWGWLGAIIGCLLYGALLGIFWTCTRFWQDERNALGAAFAFYLMWEVLTTGGDLTIVVTIIAVYLVFLGISYLQGFGTRDSGRALVPQPWSESAAPPQLGVSRPR